MVESNSSPNSCNYVKIKHQNKNNVYPNQCISVDLYLRIKTSFICSTIQYVICRFFFTTVYHYRSLNAKDLTDYNNYFHLCHYYDTAVLQCILIRDFKIGHYGRLRQLDRCHTIQNMRDLLTSSFGKVCFRQVSRCEDNGETDKSSCILIVTFLLKISSQWVKCVLGCVYIDFPTGEMKKKIVKTSDFIH